MWQRVRNRLDDRNVCLETATCWPGHGGKRTEAGDIRLTLGGAEICEASADSMSAALS
jgi:hypothetical protein